MSSNPFLCLGFPIDAGSCSNLWARVRRVMDQSAISAAAFHNLAEKYGMRYMDLTVYDASYAAFCDLLPPGRASVLDAACGPGNVSRYLLKRRGELDLLG